MYYSNFPLSTTARIENEQNILRYPVDKLCWAPSSDGRDTPSEKTLASKIACRRSMQPNPIITSLTNKRFGAEMAPGMVQTMEANLAAPRAHAEIGNAGPRSKGVVLPLGTVVSLSNIKDRRGPSSGRHRGTNRWEI